VIKKSVIAVLGLSASALALPAAAQMAAPSMSAFYIGGSLGQSKANDFCDGTSGSGVSCDDKDTAWKVFAGYQFHPNVAIELGYSDLGKAKASGGGAEISDEASAWDLTAVGSWPLANKFSVYGRLGFYHSEVTSNASVSGFGSASEDKSTTDLTFGIGARYDITRNLGVRAEWQRYNDMKDAFDTKSNVDVLSIGVLYRFQ
jgi:OOP family OmpA-OmpF porin